MHWLCNFCAFCYDGAFFVLLEGPVEGDFDFELTASLKGEYGAATE